MKTAIKRAIYTVFIWAVPVLCFYCAIVYAEELGAFTVVVVTITTIATFLLVLPTKRIWGKEPPENSKG